MKTLPTSVLQIIFKIIPNFKVIIKNIIDPDDNLYRNSQALMV